MDQKKIGFLNWVVLLAATVGLLLVSLFVNSASGVMGAIIAGIGFLVAILSWFQMRLQEREQFEMLEMEELSRTRGGTSLFETADADTFPAKRSREQFERYFVPGFTALLCLLQGFAVYFPWKLLGNLAPLQTDRATLAMALLGLFALILFMLGKYSSGLARLAGQRLLSASANYALLVAYTCFLIVVSIGFVWAEFRSADILVARGLCIVVGLIALETLLSLIMEIYRVRVKGVEVRLLYESRLAGLLGKPEALLTTAAHTLDYQFGFKVSETWFYRFLADKLPMLILAQFGVLLLSSCFVLINPGEQALLERLGAPVVGRQVLDPGLHLKLPWPIDKVYRYHTQQIQSFTVGSEAGEEHEKTITWTVAHSAEENLLVASTNGISQDTNSVENKTPPVNLIAIGVPVQYQITNLTKWAYVNKGPDALLEKLALREVVRYLASADLGELMAHKRTVAGKTLQERIQASANERDLGVRILFAGVEDIHPPQKVAGKYEEVIGALQSMEARRQDAAAHAKQTNALAGAEVYKRIIEAQTDSARVTGLAEARASFFTNQILAHDASPEVYIQRAYLQTLARSVGGARKYVIVTTNTSTDVIQINLEDKLRPDLEGVGIGRGGKKID